MGWEEAVDRRIVLDLGDLGMIRGDNYDEIYSDIYSFRFFVTVETCIRQCVPYDCYNEQTHTFSTRSVNLSLHFFFKTNCYYVFFLYVPACHREDKTI